MEKFDTKKWNGRILLKVETKWGGILMFELIFGHCLWYFLLMVFMVQMEMYM